MLSVNVWITPATSVLEKFSDESLLSGWSWWFSVQSLKFHLELIYVLNINVFMFVFKRKLIQQKVEKKLIIFLFLFTKQRIIIIIMMWVFFFLPTGEQVCCMVRITVSYQRPTVPTNFHTPVSINNESDLSRLQVSPAVCLDSPGAAAIMSLLKVHRLTDLREEKMILSSLVLNLLIQTHAVSYSKSLDEQWILNTLHCVPRTPEKQWSAQLRCQKHSKLLCINYWIIIL